MLPLKVARTVIVVVMALVDVRRCAAQAEVSRLSAEYRGAKDELGASQRAENDVSAELAVARSAADRRAQELTGFVPPLSPCPKDSSSLCASPSTLGVSCTAQERITGSSSAPQHHQLL